MSVAGAPAVRPQHVEVRVEEKQKIHNVRKTRIHEYCQHAETRGRVNDCRESIKPAMVDETWTAKLYPSLRLKEDPHTREL